MSPEAPYEPVFTPPGRRALTERLPGSVAVAVIDFLTTSVVEKPWRVGKPLRGEVASIWVARRWIYRVLHWIHEEPPEVVVIGIDHRGEAYRPR